MFDWKRKLIALFYKLFVLFSCCFFFLKQQTAEIWILKIFIRVFKWTEKNKTQEFLTGIGIVWSPTRTANSRLQTVYPAYNADWTSFKSCITAPVFLLNFTMKKKTNKLISRELQMIPVRYDDISTSIANVPRLKSISTNHITHWIQRCVIRYSDIDTGSSVG